MNLTLSHPLDWPRPARFALLIGAAMIVFASGLFFCIGEQREEERNALQRQRELQHQFKHAWEKNDQLPALRQQQNILAASALRHQEQFWSDDTLGQLQQKISRRAQECGLVLEAYQPASHRADAGQAETVIHLRGSYAGLARFFRLVAAPPQALLVTDLDIRPLNRDGSRTALQATVSLAAPLATTRTPDKP